VSFVVEDSSLKSRLCKSDDAVSPADKFMYSKRNFCLSIFSTTLLTSCTVYFASFPRRNRGWSNGSILSTEMYPSEVGCNPNDGAVLGGVHAEWFDYQYGQWLFFRSAMVDWSWLKWWYDCRHIDCVSYYYFCAVMGEDHCSHLFVASRQNSHNLLDRKHHLNINNTSIYINKGKIFH
jgi:hypothetical protein